MSGKRLFDLIPSSEISGLTRDISEVVLDSFIEEGIFKDIPFFGIIQTFYRTGRTVKEELFIRRLLEFIKKTGEIDLKSRQEFWEETDKDKSKKDLIGNKLLQIIDRVDEHKKAVWLSIALRMRIHNQITEIEFFDLIHAIDRFKFHLRHLFFEYNNGFFQQKEEYLNHFVQLGLLNNSALNISDIMIKGIKIELEKPSIANYFCQIIWETEKESLAERHRSVLMKKYFQRETVNQEIVRSKETLKQPIDDFFTFLSSLSNDEFIKLKPTTNYLIIDDNRAVLCDTEYAYYFNFKGWYNSGMIY